MKAARHLILTMAIAAILSGCGTIGGLAGGGLLGGGESLSVRLLSDNIEAPRGEDGELTREGRLLTHGAFILTVAEAASLRSMPASERQVVAVQLQTAGEGLLEAAEGDGWFLRTDAQYAVNLAIRLVGEAAVDRAFRIASGGASLEGAIELAETGQTSVNMLADIRGISLAYQSGELTEAEVVEILRGRFDKALSRLEG